MLPGSYRNATIGREPPGTPERKNYDAANAGTPLPAVGENDEKAYTQMSDRFKEHTVIEIEKENRLQASEKVWGSVSHALKAVAEQRGWQGDTHSATLRVGCRLFPQLRFPSPG